jgi:1-phosphofructokinase family hexose kinase
MIYTVTLNPTLDRTLTVPQITFDQVLRATSLQLDWGGKGFNVSRALKALGGESLALGFAGGATGQILEHGLNELGIPTALTHIRGETRSTTVIIDESSGRHVKVNELGPQISPQEAAALLEEIRQLVAPGDTWVISGSLPPGLRPGFYADLVQLVQAQGGRVFLDASSEPFCLGCAAAPFGVKPNTLEASQASGIPIDSEESCQQAAEYFIKQGIRLVAVSMGEYGLLLVTPEGWARAYPPRLPAPNPTGAGDALLAGVVWALERKYNLEVTARWGVACGTASAARPGVSFGSLEEVSAIARLVTLDHS